MTARKPEGYACHIDPDLAHTGPDTPEPCTRRHKPAPANASTTQLTKLGLHPITRTKLHPDPKQPRIDLRTATGIITTNDLTGAAKPSSSARSGAKTRATPPKAGGSYSDGDKELALDLIRDVGIARAHATTGIPKATLSRWAKAAGVDLGEQARARTRAATAAVEARAAEAALTTVGRLEGILELELTTHARLAELEAAASARMAAAVELVRAGEPVVEASIGMMGAPYLVLEQPQSELGQLLGLLELAGKTLSKRDVVGAWTRAVHDLALLKGDATERGTILVRFGIPRPDAAAADAAAVDEQDLTPTGGTP